jgi:hypothetical protein
VACLRAQSPPSPHAWHLNPPSTSEPSAVSQHSALNSQLNFRFAEISSPPLKGADLIAIVEAWKSGAISRETFLEALKRSQLLPDGRGVADEKKLLFRTANA